MPASIVDCASYSKEDVRAALDLLLEEMGGLAKYVPEGANVLIKVNLLRAMAPEKAATTHPAVVEALAGKLISERGATVVVGDSPGGLFNARFVSGVYKATGMAEACENSGAQLNSDFGSTELVNSAGVVLKTMSCIDAFLKADVVINFAKFKTHGLTGFTGCVKNLFGLIPGLQKVGLHSRFDDINSFCDCLVDIERFASGKIALHLIDGVVGMHKDGPSAGEPIALNKLIASDNAYHADCLAASVFGDPLGLPVIQKAVERGLLKSDLSDVPYDLASIEKNKDFISVPPHRFGARFLPKWIQRLARRLTTKKAKILSGKCAACKTCVGHCPKNAINVKKSGKVKIKQRKCIRCYCCHELCPFGAVGLKIPFLRYGMKKSGKKEDN